MTRLVISEYSKLRDEVRKTLIVGQERIDQEKVRTYWQTGHLINEYLAGHTPSGKERAEYNRQVVENLARDLDLTESILYRCARFALQFKKVAARQLSWTHYRALLAVSDEKIRLRLADRAERLELNSRELEAEIKKLGIRWAESGNGRGKKSYELLIPKKGTPYAYRLIRSDKIHTGKTDLRIDLGFSNYREASMKGAENFKAGDIVVSEWVKADTYRLVKAAGKTEADLQRRTAPSLGAGDAVVAQPVQLFAYYAYIERVVDGDTLLVQVDLGFGEWTRQYLRLRDIDCPEIDTSIGRRAKRFVEKELSSVPYVVITSSRSDKYDRYLADVFYTNKTGGQFLNNRLLQERLAVRT